MFASFGRGDFSSSEWAHPEIEFVLVEGPEPGSWTGVAGMRESWRGWLGAWEDVRFEAEEYRELDDGRVLVLVHVTGGRGKTSGLELRGGVHGGSNPVRGAQRQGDEVRQLLGARPLPRRPRPHTGHRHLTLAASGSSVNV